jgi:hypothetical protein
MKIISKDLTDNGLPTMVLEITDTDHFGVIPKLSRKLLSWEGNLEIKPAHVCFPEAVSVKGHIKGSAVSATDAIEAGSFIHFTGEVKSGNYVKAGGFIHCSSNLKTENYIVADGSIFVGGRIECKSCVTASDYIRCNGSVECGIHLQAKGAIWVDGVIYAGTHIKCHNLQAKRIFAGLCDWKDLSDQEMLVTCWGLIGNTVLAHGKLNIVEKPKELVLPTAVMSDDAFEGKTIVFDNKKYVLFKAATSYEGHVISIDGKRFTLLEAKC